MSVEFPNEPYDEPSMAALLAKWDLEVPDDVSLLAAGRNALLHKLRNKIRRNS